MLLSLRRELGSILVLPLIAALVVLWALAYAVVERVRLVEHASASRELTTLAKLVADHTDRSFQSVDLALKVINERIDDAAEHGRTKADDLHRILAAGMAGIPQISSILVLAPDGTSIGDSASPVPRPFNGMDREFFVRHATDGMAGLIISDPYKSRISGQWVINLSRRLNDSSGSFAGTLSAAVDPRFFQTTYAAADAAKGATATVFKRSGVILASTLPEADKFLGRVVNAPGFSRDELERSPHGSLETVSPLTGTRRLLAFAAAKAYPIYVIIGWDVAELSLATHSSALVAFSCATLISILLVILVRRIARDRHSLNGRFVEGIERMPDGFMLWDGQERLIAWNSRLDIMLPQSAACRRAGTTLEDYAAEAAEAVLGEVPQAERAAAISTRIERFRQLAGPWKLILRDGRTLEVEESRTRSGGMVTIVRDATVRVAEKAALAKALDVERESSAMQRRFIAMASHEFRTPLAIIDGAAQRLLRAQQDPEIAKRATRIREAVLRMTGLIERVLSSTRQEEAAIVARADPFDLAALLTEIVERYRRLRPDFDLALQMPAEAVTIKGDRQLLDAVFSNLASNAMKYAGNDKRAEIVLGLAEAGVHVRVSDRGIGIPEHEVPMLFSRFFRASNAAGIPGTGIGLYLVREFVTLHGGTVEVFSALHQGATFQVRLPFRRALAPRESAAA